MLLCYFLNLQKQHMLYFGQMSSGAALLLCRCSVVVLMVSSGKFHPPPATRLAKTQLGGGENKSCNDGGSFPMKQQEAGKSIKLLVMHCVCVYIYIA